MSEKINKTALKQLRETRKAYIEKARKAIKTQNDHIKRIRTQIAGQGKTVPGISVSTQLPSDLVLYYISSLKKFGMVVEGAKEGDYFTYQWVTQKNNAEENEQ